MELKTCIVCKQGLLLEDFPLRQSDGTNRRNECKECRSKQRKVYYLENKEEDIKRSIEYNKTHNFIINCECGINF